MSTSGGSRASSRARRFEKALRDHALGYPESYEEMPWGHRAIKVRKKAFVFLGINDDGVFVCVKLPESNTEALDEDFAEPTGYGLGKSGWVTGQFGMDDEVPVAQMCAWIDESYRAIAPKKLIRVLDGEPAPAKKKTATRKKAGARKALPKRKVAKKTTSGTAGRKKSTTRKTSR